MACERAAAVGVVKGGRNMRKPHWIRKTHLFRADEYICSKCGAKSPGPYRSCPRCGSNMTGEKYDPTCVDEMEAISAILDDDW